MTTNPKNILMKPITKSMNELLPLLKISKSKFNKDVGIAKQTLDNILHGTNLPSLTIIYKILEVYPDINPAWLLTNEGEPILSKSISTQNETAQRIARLEERIKELSKLSQLQEFTLEILKNQVENNNGKRNS